MDAIRISDRTDHPASVDRRWLYYLAAGALAVCAYYAVPAGMPGRGLLLVVIYCLVSASGAVAVALGVRWHRPRPLLPWVLLGAAQTVYAAADCVFYVCHYLRHAVAYPSVADALYLGHYPLVVVALAVLTRRRTQSRDVAGLLDAAMLAIAAGLLSWVCLIAPLVRSPATPLVRLTSLAYPAMDLALLTVALLLVFGPGRRPGSFYLLAGSLLAIFGADTLYVYQQLHGTYAAGNFLDAIWLAGNLALGAAALHPTMSRLGERSLATENQLGAARICALLAAALIGPAALLVQYAAGTTANVPAAAIVCALLVTLTIGRMAWLVAVQRRLAITDQLTGLHTRRFLSTQLDLEVARAKRGGGSLDLLIIDVDYFKSINDRYGHPAGDRALAEISARLAEASRAGDVLARYGGEEFALLVPGAGEGELRGIAERVRARVAGTPVAVSDHRYVAVTVSVGAVNYPAHGSTPVELVATADRALYAAKAGGRDRAVTGDGANRSPQVLASAREPMADYLHRVADDVDAQLSPQEHSTAVSRWAALLATAHGLDEDAVRHAELAGRLHDVGKVVLPEAVLGKRLPLVEEEWRLLKLHPEYGARLARLVPGFGTVAEIIRQHHERYDGGGYPDGLAASDIRIEARLLAVCDSWAAMRSDRFYRQALSEDEAREQLRLGRGTQFDPDVVDQFLDLHDRDALGQLRRLGQRPERTATPADPQPGLTMSASVDQNWIS